MGLGNEVHCLVGDMGVTYRGSQVDGGGITDGCVWAGVGLANVN